MTIRVPEPSSKYGFLHPASAFGFMTPDGRWWRSLEDWLSSYTPPDGSKLSATYVDDDVLAALRLKFAFNHDIRRRLADTGKKEIASARRGQDHWLGHALMKIRREFQSGDWAMNLPWTPFTEASFDKEVEKAHGPNFIGVFINSRYQVGITQDEVEGFPGPVDHLSIKRWDKEPLGDWREKQRIKNELCGMKREACELFPSEDRLVDTANQYHLWVLPPGILFPFGFFERVVAHPDANPNAKGSKQRPFLDAPPDALTAEQIQEEIVRRMDEG